MNSCADINNRNCIYRAVCNCTLWYISAVQFDWQSGAVADIFDCDYATGYCGDIYSNAGVACATDIGNDDL